MEETATPAGRSRHWDSVYRERGPAGVSWFQPEPGPSLDLLEALRAGPGDSLVDVGGGASLLVDRLAERGWQDLTVLDVSAAALAAARDRHPDTAVTYLHRDLLQWTPDRRFDVWHDRAVLHFLTEPADQDRYRRILEQALGPGGAVVLGGFAPDGPDRCSGLPVVRRSAEELAAFLGAGFAVVAARREEHVTPWGAVQPFTWVAARRPTPPGG